MSLPVPIIPQTPDQAVARDVLAGLKPVQPADPAVDLARLRAAVREHHHEMESAGPLGLVDDFTPEQVAVMDRKHAADRRLWELAGIDLEASA